MPNINANIMLSFWSILYWLKTQGVYMLMYLIIGIGVYGQLEGWSAPDTVYFLIVTSTTVGYGDLCPETPAGRLFTCFYALVGIFALMSAATPIGAPPRRLDFLDVCRP